MLASSYPRPLRESLLLCGPADPLNSGQFHLLVGLLFSSPWAVNLS